MERRAFLRIFYHVALAALVGVAGPGSSWADLVNIAQARFFDASGNTYTVNSNPNTITVDNSNQPPSPPAGLDAKEGDSEVQLRWRKNKESDLAGYNVYRSLVSGGSYIKLNSALVPADPSPRYEDKGVVNGETYYYVATAVDDAGKESGYSNEASATPQGKHVVRFEMELVGDKRHRSGKRFVPAGSGKLKVVWKGKGSGKKGMVDVLPDRIEIVANDQDILARIVPVEMRGEEEVSLWNLQDGSYELMLRAIQDGTVIYQGEPQGPFWVRKKAPSAPVVMVKGDMLEVTGAASDLDFELAFYAKQAQNSVTSGNSAVLARGLQEPVRTATISESSFNLKSLGFAVGTYQVSVTAIDGAGNRSEPVVADFGVLAAALDNVRIFPNPWRADQHNRFPMTFDRLTAGSTVKIFTIAGHWVKTLDSTNGTATWDLTNDSGDRVASGLYLYLIADNQGEKARGKLGIIK